MLFWVFFYFLDPGYDGSVSITNPYLRENKLFETEILQCQAQEGQCLWFFKIEIQLMCNIMSVLSALCSDLTFAYIMNDQHSKASNHMSPNKVIIGYILYAVYYIPVVSLFRNWRAVPPNPLQCLWLVKPVECN